MTSMISYPTITPKGAAAFLLFSALSWLAVDAKAAVLDAFTLNQAVVDFTPANGPESGSVVDTPPLTIVGGTRDVSVDQIAGPGTELSNANVIVENGTLAFSNSVNVAGEATIQWDATPGSTLEPNGLGGLNLRSDGSDALVLDFPYVDLNTSYIARAYSGPSNYTEVTVGRGATIDGDSQVIPFSIFECGDAGSIPEILSVNCVGTGAQMSDLGALELVLNVGGVTEDLDMVVGPITTEQLRAALGDFVWEDCNGNGIQDAGDCDGDGTVETEPGISDVMVNLLTPGTDGLCGTDGQTVLDTDTTDANGLYLFPDLDPGAYCVEFVKPTGYECTLDNQGMNNELDSDVLDQGDGTCQTVDPDQNPIDLVGNETDLSWDAGLIRLASLGDRVWNDKDRDNVQGPGDMDLPGTTVTLKDCDGNVITEDFFDNPIAPIITGPDGAYEFVNLPPGGYKVLFDGPAGFEFVTPKVGSDDTVDSDAQAGGLTACITLPPGQNNPDIDAGLFEPATSRLGDLLWDDLNADGIQDDINGPNGEPGIGGVDVELFQCEGGAPIVGDALDTATTNDSGFYFFDNLAPGSYAVRFPVEALKAVGYRVSPQNAGNPNDDAVDSDADPDTGFTACVDLGVNDENLTLDAGVFKPASLGDFVWDDSTVTRNDIQDPNEQGVPGVLVTLEDCSGNPVATDIDGNQISPIVTGPDGAYSYTNLRPGKYIVRFEPPTDSLGDLYAFVQPKQGNDDTIDSDAINRATACTTLESGENNPDLDAGLYPLAVSSLGDLVWNDLNADGIQDGINGQPNGEPGIPNVTVELLECDANGNATPTGITETTNADGFYLFDGLRPGSYAVRFPVDVLKAAGWKVSPQNNPDTTDDLDSDADPNTGLTACVDLGVADQDLTLDAGFFKPASLGDFVWDDDSVTRNNLQDTGEAGVSGVLVELEDCFGSLVTTDVDGSPITSITTGPDGAYTFDKLRPGGYKVRFVLPANYEFVTPNVGAPNVDSDAVVQTDGSGLSQCVTLQSGDNDPTIDAGVFLAIPDCDLTVEKNCQIILPPTPGDFVCSDAKPLDVLTMISAAQRTITSIDYYAGTYDPNDPAKDRIGTIPGPINLGDEVSASGFAAANAPNDVQWVMTFADDTTGISQFHRSCSDSEMNDPTDCGKLQGNGKGDDADLLNIWKLEGLEGNGLALDCTPPDPLPSTVNECEFSTPAPPHCLGKVESIGFRYVNGDCLIEPNTQDGKAMCTLPGVAGEPVRIVVSDGGSKVYLDTGSPGTVHVGDVVTATAANAGENDFSSNSVISIFSETGTLLQEVEFHTSCSKPLNLGDRYGSLEVVSMDTTEGGTVALGVNVQYDYIFTNNSVDFPFKGKAVDDVLGDVLDPLELMGGETVTETKEVFVLPDDTDAVTNTVTVTADNGAFCGQASATVTRVPPPPGPVSCSDIKPVTAVSVIWDGDVAVDIVMESGEEFLKVQPGNQITFQEAGTGNDVEMFISNSETGVQIGESVFHVSCSDDNMNGTEDCGNNVGDRNGGIADWLFDGMDGENGSFDCDLPNTGVVEPEDGGVTGGVIGADVADLSDAKKFKWALTNTTNQDLFVTDISVTWPDGVNGHGQLKKMKLEGDFGKDLFDATSPTTMPGEYPFDPDDNKRKLKAGDTKNLEIEFTEETLYRDQTDFQVVVTFSNGDVVTFTPAPLFVTAAATLDLSDDKKVKWELTNNTTGDLLITEVNIGWPAGHAMLKKVKLDGDVAKDINDTASPTSVPTDKAFESDPNKRTLEDGETRNLEIEFDTGLPGRDGSEFTIEVKFSNDNVVTFP